MRATETPTTIAVTIILCAQLKDRFGADTLQAVLPSSATGADLRSWLIQRNPRAEGLVKVSRLAVNCEYVQLDHVLRDGDEVIVIPPVSGG